MAADFLVRFCEGRDCMDKQQREYIHHLMLQYSDAMVRYWRPAEIASKGPARKANCGAKEKAITEFFQILYTEQ